MYNLYVWIIGLFLTVISHTKLVLIVDTKTLIVSCTGLILMLLASKKNS